MRHTQVSPARMTNRRRVTTNNNLTFSRFATTLGIAAVMALLGTTFLGDYLSVPNLAVSASPEVISPNGDRTQNVASINYTLEGEGSVQVQVLTANGAPIVTLADVANQASGQYSIVWDGINAANELVADGRYIIEVTAAGAFRSVVQRAEVQIDTEPPLLHLTNLDDLARVSNPSLTIEGVTEPGATVYQAGMAAAIPVDNQGIFKLERQLTEGTNILEILASDQAGNTTSTSHEVSLITQPPDLTLTKPGNDTWFNQAVVEVAGVAPNASSVKLNNQAINLLADGTFKHEIILQEGDNTLRIEATDDVGNVTVRKRLVHLKTSPPEISLNLDEGAVYQQSTVRLTGRTDPGSTVLINNQIVPVSTLGEFQTPLDLLNGINVINIKARDIAGNTAMLSRQVSFQSPVPQNEVTQFFNRLPDLSSWTTPLLLAVPSLLLLGYFFTRPVSLQLSADRDNFTPGLPAESETMNMVLDLSRDARITMQVLNAQQRPVATIINRRQRRAGEQVFQWDGYDDYGHVVPSGEYTIQATASTPGASVHSAVPLTIYEDPVVHKCYHNRTTSPLLQTDLDQQLRPRTRRTRRS